MHGLARRLFSLDKLRRLSVLVASDATVVAIAFLLAIESDPGGVAFWQHLAANRWLVALGLVAGPMTFLLTGLYKMVFRYGGDAIFFGIMRSATVFIAVLGVVLALADPRAFSVSLLFIAWALTMLGLSATRFAVVWLYNRTTGAPKGSERVVIYGAGEAGVAVLRAMRGSRFFQPIAFFDDDPDRVGRRVRGCAVHDPSTLDRFIRERKVKTVVLAMPSLEPEGRQHILRRLENLPVRVRTVPPLHEMLDNHVRLSQIRDISAQDVLWRPVVEPQPELLSRDVRDSAVMVTGGGGSIGSELCRQIVKQRPRKLVVFDASEFALYSIAEALKRVIAATDPAIELVSILGSVLDERQLREICSRHEIRTIYHAAAYKHVPLVEMNPLVGLMNNAIGSARLASAAMAAGVEKVVLISTDKAVRPTSLMGASKRLAEMVFQALGALRTGTCFTMVRFGNVLDSNGSVVPTFRRQIASGTPVTVTHRDITRYFMTIPEASSLVLQAGAMAGGGEVFVLDMGEPVRIYDLAVRLIHLSGQTVRDAANPDGDIPIEITGLRPGEKMYEELVIGADTQPTAHRKIMKVTERFVGWSQLEPMLKSIQNACTANDRAAVVRILCDLVPEYTPSDVISAPRRESVPTKPRLVEDLADPLPQRKAVAG